MVDFVSRCGVCGKSPVDDLALLAYLNKTDTYTPFCRSCSRVIFAAAAKCLRDRRVARYEQEDVAF